MSCLRALARRKWLCAALTAIIGSVVVGLLQASPPQKAPSDERDAALARLGVDRWHDAGMRGHGVKVAVLDSGFHDYRSFLSKALPAAVLVNSFQRDGNLEARDSQHGILCGEVIHAVAPDAELLFANWDPDRPLSLIEAVKWAKQQGAKVLSCSLIMPSWSDGEGGGEIHAGLVKVVGLGAAKHDLLFFASAGNLAQRHWSGPLLPDEKGYHQWTTGRCGNTLLPWGDERVSVELYGQGSRDLELQVYDAATGKTIGHCRSESENTPSGCPCAVVCFQPRPGARYEVRVRGDTAAQNTNNGAFHLAVLGGALHYTTAAGSIPFPGDGTCVQAVGAVDSDGRRLSYSSCGPNSQVPKPDFVAPVPFPSSWRERPFAGTSAAAPQAAGLAALVWAQHPDWTAGQVCTELRRASLHVGPVGHDWETGYGMLRLPSLEGDLPSPIHEQHEHKDFDLPFTFPVAISPVLRCTP